MSSEYDEQYRIFLLLLEWFLGNALHHYDRNDSKDIFNEAENYGIFYRSSSSLTFSLIIIIISFFVFFFNRKCSFRSVY